MSNFYCHPGKAGGSPMILALAFAPTYSLKGKRAPPMSKGRTILWFSAAKVFWSKQGYIPVRNGHSWRNLRVQPQTAFWRIALVVSAPDRCVSAHCGNPIWRHQIAFV